MVQYAARLDTAFAALSDPTRRGILERLGQGDASISDLAVDFEMTLTGIKKHLRVLEGAGLVASRKVGRVRHCRLGRQSYSPCHRQHLYSGRHFHHQRPCLVCLAPAILEEVIKCGN